MKKKIILVVIAIIFYCTLLQSLYAQQTHGDDVYSVVKCSFTTLAKKIPKNKVVAVFGIDPAVRDSVLVTNLLEYFFVNSGEFIIVERRDISIPINEGIFGTSIFVDDSSAIQLGKMLAAEYIVLGVIAGEGSDKKLFLRALSTETGVIVSLSSHWI